MVLEGGLTNNPVIIDNVNSKYFIQGSGIIKAGLAGKDQPKCFIPSMYSCKFDDSIGRPKHQRAMAGAVEGDSFIGNKAQELRGILSVTYPMEHGIVTNWSDMEKIWNHVYSEELQVLSEEVYDHLNLASCFAD
jgi:centractin